MPPTSHARYTSLAEPTACIISLGTRKIPLPMIVPTTTAEAWLTPRSRESSGRGSVCRICSAMVEVCQYTSARAPSLCGRFWQKQARQVAHGECHDRPNHHPPCPWNRCPFPQRQFHAEAKQHAHHGAALVGFSRQHSQQKNSEQSAISYRGDLQPHLNHASHFLQRQHCQPEKYHRPEQSRQPGELHARLLIGIWAQAQKKIHDRARGKRIQRSAQIRHGGCEDRRNQQPRDSVRHLTDDECGIDSIRLSKVCRGHSIERPQHYAHNQKESELEQNCQAARKQ